MQQQKASRLPGNGNILLLASGLQSKQKQQQARKPTQNNTTKTITCPKEHGKCGKQAHMHIYKLLLPVPHEYKRELE